MKWINVFSTKQTFLALTFVTLIIQLIITRITMTKAPKKQNKWYKIGLFLASLVLLLFMSFPSVPIVIKFLLFCVFSFINGYLFGSYDVSETIIQFAFYGAIGVFVFMGGIGLLLSLVGIQLGFRFGLGLFFALLAFFLLSLFNLFTGDVPQKLIASFGILLFSLYILYDTNVILQRNYQGDFISASIDYYLDFINVFVNLINFQNE
jgi:FtsH-binding integral membrane protein